MRGVDTSSSLSRTVSLGGVAVQRVVEYRAHGGTAWRCVWGAWTISAGAQVCPGGWRARLHRHAKGAEWAVDAGVDAGVGGWDAVDAWLPGTPGCPQTRWTWPALADTGLHCQTLAWSGHGPD
jgi:hypothetical protein